MTRWFALCITAAMLAVSGCGGEPIAAQKPAAKKKAKKTEPKKLDIKPVEVKADEFPSVEAALSELEQVLKLPDGGERNLAEIRVQNWLVLQQDKAVPLVAARAADTSESLEMRITTCRILSKLGPAAIDTLLDVAEHAESKQLRSKAIQSLGGMKPPEKKTIEKLIVLLDDADTQVKWYVIDALIKIGAPAKAAAAKLSELRQKHPEEQIRFSAGEALKQVDPRHTFVE